MTVRSLLVCGMLALAACKSGGGASGPNLGPAPVDPELAKQKAQIAASLRQQKQSELFRAFVVEARDRYEVTRNPQAWRRALGQE